MKKEKTFVDMTWFNRNGCRECPKLEMCKVLWANYNGKVRGERAGEGERSEKVVRRVGVPHV